MTALNAVLTVVGNAKFSSASLPVRGAVVLVVLFVVALPFLEYAHLVSTSSPLSPASAFIAPSRHRQSPDRPGGTTASTGVIQPSEACPTAAAPAGRSPLDGRWYNYSSPSFQLFVYSALLDDRESLFAVQSKPRPTAYVRLIVIATRDDVIARKNVTVTLRCRLYYHHGEGGSSTRTVDVPMEPDRKPVGYGWTLNGETVREYIYACPITGTSIPTAVSVLRDGAVGDATWSATAAVASCVPVERPARPAVRRNMAVCVPVAFGSRLDGVRLVEWLELQRLLGVELVGVYSLDVSGPALDVLRQYARDGFVDLRTTTYIPDGPSENILFSTPVVNDCLYRHMYDFRWIAVLDLDELIVPENGSVDRLDHLVDRLQRADGGAAGPVSYVFRNSYFFLDIPTDANDQLATSYLATLRHRKKVALSAQGYSVKSVIDPQACVNMHNHYCWSSTAGHADRELYKDVDPQLATNRHYKRCHFNADKCAAMMSHVTRDDVMLRFRDRLSKAVRQKIASDFAGMNLTAATT